MQSWISIPAGSHFSLANIPFGIITSSNHESRVPAVAIGEHVLDLHAFTTNNGFSKLSTIQPHQHVFSQPTLNGFAALGRPMHAVVRKYLQSVFLEETPYAEVLKDNTALQKQCLLKQSEVQMCLPMKIGNYTDFFVGMNHAYNTGQMFRGPDNALNANYKHLPVGYHGRASSVVVSGTSIRRPRGQFLDETNPGSKTPIYAPTRKLDFELELAAFVCKENTMGEPIDVNEAKDYIFGFVLMNDWSVRDVQAWEYVPLGPFTGKNLGTSVSPWVVLADALEPFRAEGLQSGVEPLPYLKEETQKNMYDIKLEVELTTEAKKTSTICKTSSSNLLFSFPQMLAQHTVTGCPMEVGDLIASGTISGIGSGTLGCLLEATRGGKEPISLQDNEERRFLVDGDTVTLRGYCGTESEGLVGFGECSGTILPPHESKR